MGVLFGAESGREKKLFNQIGQTGQQLGAPLGSLGGLADTAQYQGKRAIKGGIKDINLVGDYYKSLLTGDREKLTETLSPEIRAVMDQYDSTKRTMSEFGPRGGGTVGELSQLEGQKEGRISDLYAGAREKGAKGLEGVGSILSSLGVSEQGVATSALGQLIQGILGEQGVQLGELSATGKIEQRKQGAIQGLGEFIGGIISDPLSDLFGGLIGV